LTLDWGGPVGDRHAGITTLSDSRLRYLYARGTEVRNHRQVSLVDEDEMRRVAANLVVPDIEPGLIGDNIYTAGLPNLTATAPLTRLVFEGGAVLVVNRENGPCTIAGAMVQRVHGTAPQAFPKAAIHLRGITAWVERVGVIRIGEAIDVVADR
jgi:MOSC domain-containing protein YiiM